jgi:hypothetical protein
LALSQAELREGLTLPDLSEHPHRFGDPVYSFSLPGERAIATWRDLNPWVTGLWSSPSARI